MSHAVDAAFREELRNAGLAGQGALPRLLALLRAAPETHLTLAEVADIAAESGLAITLADLARQMEALADHGLISRLATTTADLVFDTVAEPHSHLFYEQAGQIIDLHVSSETLLAMIRQALAERPGGVEILVRYRRDPPAGINPETEQRRQPEHP